MEKKKEATSGIYILSEYILYLNAANNVLGWLEQEGMWVNEALSSIIRLEYRKLVKCKRCLTQTVVLQQEISSADDCKVTVMQDGTLTVMWLCNIAASWIHELEID